MKAKHTYLLPLIFLLLQACVWGNNTSLSDKTNIPTGYYREAKVESRKPFGDGLPEFYRFERNKTSNYCTLTVFNRRKPEENGLYLDQTCDGKVDVYVGGQTQQPILRDETFENNQDLIYKAKLKILDEH